MTLYVSRAAFIASGLVWCAIAVSSQSISPAIPGQSVIPRFEEAPCAITVPESEKTLARCGYLVVPENRSRRDSRLIRLPVIIQKSNSPNPAPDPVLRMLGGPGASSLRMVRGRRSSPWIDRRNVVILEQRGTQYAQPRLNCPEVAVANAASARAKLDESAALQREVEAAGICRERLVREGIDLAGYNSAESAHDIEDLRRLLGYRQWNLYGVSYSSRLMLEVMRDYPAGIRSVVLESVLPPQVNYDEVGVDGAMRALKLVFSKCLSDSECSRVYPDLEKKFSEVVTAANKKPIPFEIKLDEGPVTVTLNGNDIITWLLDYLLSVDAAAIADLPLQVYRFGRGDFKALQSFARDKVSPGSQDSLGMRYSVWCREEMPFENRTRISAQSVRKDALNGYTIQSYFPPVCRLWKVPPAPAVENKPVRSDIPTLLLTGEYDAYTPPEWGRMTARTLRNSYFFEVPWTGHGPGFSNSCARQMVAAFFDDPRRAPDGSCLIDSKRRFAIDK